MPNPYQGKNRSLTPYEPFRRANARRRGLISPRSRTLTLEEQIARDEERAREVAENEQPWEEVDPDRVWKERPDPEDRF